MFALRNLRSPRTDPTPGAGVAAAALRAATVVSLALLGPALASAAPPAASAPHTPIKWIDASGRVHYSDRKPLPDTMGQTVTPQAVSARPPAPSIGDPSLPWALRSAAARYPVTLYTSLECEPCQLAREHLAQRGVPYTEKRVEDARDVQAFRSLGFEKALFPSVSIGPERLVGYESIGWDRALDATGYPKSSMLPARRDPRRVAPMRTETPPVATPAPAAETTETADHAAEARTAGTDSLLSPSSFHTGPNPIRF